VNKDARDWTLEYFSKHLPGISAEENGITAKIEKVLGVEGDVDVSQRKGKVISIYDVKVRLEYSGMWLLPFANAIQLTNPLQARLPMARRRPAASRSPK
jgi:activator of HSP90 ATPase